MGGESKDGLRLPKQATIPRGGLKRDSAGSGVSSSWHHYSPLQRPGTARGPRDGPPLAVTTSTRVRVTLAF